VNHLLSSLPTIIRKVLAAAHIKEHNKESMSIFSQQTFPMRAGMIAEFVT
jgi:hypothetical protein